MLKVFLALTAAAVAVACSPGDPAPDRAVRTVEVAGRYGQSGAIGYLELEESGQFECFIVNGMTLDGCGTFEGAGLSRGTWSFRDGVITFAPVNEPADLVLSLIDASAVPSEEGLVLTAQGRSHLLARHDPRGEEADTPPQTKEPSAGH